MVILNHEVSRKQLLNLFVLFILIIGIPVGVFLTLQHQDLKSHASIADQSHLEIFGPSVSNGVSTSRDVKVRLVYITPITTNTCKGQTLDWDQVDSQLRGASFPGPFDHTQQELDAYNRATCPEKVDVTTCLNEVKSWSQIDSDLKIASYSGVFDHTQQELDAYNKAACSNAPVVVITDSQADKPINIPANQNFKIVTKIGDQNSNVKMSIAPNPVISSQDDIAYSVADQAWEATFKSLAAGGPVSINIQSSMKCNPGAVCSQLIVVKKFQINVINIPTPSSTPSPSAGGIGASCGGFVPNPTICQAGLQCVRAPGSNPDSGGTCQYPSPSPVLEGVSIDESRNGSIVNLTPGQRIKLTLNSTYWTIQSASDSAVLTQISKISVTPDLTKPLGSGAGTEVAEYQANSFGSTGITATRTTCGEALACQPDQRNFSVNIVVGAPPSPSAVPSGSPPATFPTGFRLANSLGGLDSASLQVFDTNNKEVNWQLSSGNGTKTVYAQFQLPDNNWTSPISADITLNEPVRTTSFQIGVNMVTAPSYGYGDLRSSSHASDVDADLKEVSEMGGTIVRVFAANNQISSDEAAKRLDSFLSEAAKYKISVIVSLIDFYGGPWDHTSMITAFNNAACGVNSTQGADLGGTAVKTCKGTTETWGAIESQLLGAGYGSGHNPQGTDQFYAKQGSLGVLGNDFFASGYKQSYESFVQTVVSANKKHSNIYAWEPGNELEDSSSPQTFINFMKDIISTIKALDPSHSIATGMIRATHTGLVPIQLYTSLPDVDIITVHPYNGSTDGTEDVAWATQNGKTAIVEETGISGTNDRSPQMKQVIDYWKSHGASALLQWGFLAKTLGNNGDGDSDVGMDGIWHIADYDKLMSLFQSEVSVPNSPVSTVIPSASPSPVSSPPSHSKSADFNNDGKVNSVDAAIFIKNWIADSKSPSSDLNSDGVVNTVDFSLLLKNISL